MTDNRLFKGIAPINYIDSGCNNTYVYMYIQSMCVPLVELVHAD